MKEVVAPWLLSSFLRKAKIKFEQNRDNRRLFSPNIATVLVESQQSFQFLNLLPQSNILLPQSCVLMPHLFFSDEFDVSSFIPSDINCCQVVLSP